MASAILVEDSPITSLKIKTRLADGWIRYQELVGYIMLEPVFFFLLAVMWAVSSNSLGSEFQFWTGHRECPKVTVLSDCYIS